jgi:protein-tyrosine phosphatase
MEGSINFRDFGGYQTQDGRRVKLRHLFRCGSLSMLSDEGQATFGELNISVICDLRKLDEAAMGSTPTHPPFDCRQSIPIEQGSTQMLRDCIRDPAQTSADRVRLMTELTRELAKNHHEQYKELFQHLLEAENGFLLHCTAGKDRTGFGAALILSALGVDEPTIMDDYLLTNDAVCLFEFMNTRMKAHYGAHFDDASLAAVGGVRQEYLQAAFDQIQGRHGSVDNYLQEIGIGPEQKLELRNRLLE